MQSALPCMQSVVRALYAFNAASAAPFKVVVAAAGGGVEGIRLLLATEGASSTILECSQPYSREAFQSWCGDGPGGQKLPPDFQYASQAAAIALAAASLRRAKRLVSMCPESATSLAATRLVGIGLAGALRSEPPRRGEHRCHVAVATDATLCLREVVLDKGAGRSRAEEDAACGCLLIEALCQTIRHEDGASASRIAPLPIGHSADANVSSASSAGVHLFAPGDVFTEHVFPLGDPIHRLLAADPLSASAAAPALPSPLQTAHSMIPVTHVLYPASLHGVDFRPVVNAALPSRVVVLPGSFNPLHAGHVRLGEAAAALLAARDRRDNPPGHGPPEPWGVVYELSAANVDKPPLAADVVASRVAQFAPAAWAVARGRGSSVGHGASSGAHGIAPHPSSGGGGGAVVVTSCARFVEKARLFPGSSFVVSAGGASCSCITSSMRTHSPFFQVGYDTAVRLLAPRYYAGGTPAAVVDALLPLRLIGTVFLVAGRVEPGGRFQSFETDLRPLVPPSLNGLFIGIPEEAFREDVSSTQLRAEAAAHSAPPPASGQSCTHA